MTLDQVITAQFETLEDDALQMVEGGGFWDNALKAWSQLSPAFEKGGAVFGGYGSYRAYR